MKIDVVYTLINFGVDLVVQAVDLGAFIHVTSWRHFLCQILS